MKKNKKAFSLIEVLMATWILTIAVFWVYRLIWENSKVIGNSNTYLQTNNMITPLMECIENIWFDNFKNNTVTNYYFDFWPNLTWCFTWTTSTWMVFDNIEYEWTWNITGSWTTYIDWSLWVSTQTTWKITKDYKQIKN